MPIFPDVYDPEIEDIDDIVMSVDDEPVVVTINATDRDNNDANIRYSLIDSPLATADDEDGSLPVEVALEGNRLTLTPKAIGSRTIGFAVESNGKVVNHAVNVSVRDMITGVDSVVSAEQRISCDGRTLTVSGFNGTSFDIVNPGGIAVDSFTANSDNYIHTLAVNQRHLHRDWRQWRGQENNCEMIRLLFLTFLSQRLFMPLRKISITPVALSSSMKTGMGTEFHRQLSSPRRPGWRILALPGYSDRKPRHGAWLHQPVWRNPGGTAIYGRQTGKDPGATIVGGRISIADASTMKLIKQLQLIDPSGKQCDGRAFCGVTSTKGYVSSSNGIRVLNRRR